LGLGFDLPDGATPIDPDQAIGLIPSLTTLAELNLFEAANIADAVIWATGHRRFLRTLLSDDGLRHLYKRMFDKTWRWAGLYRRTEKSIGMEAYRISLEVRSLVADVECWLELETNGAPEVAARFHHRLTQIHPFANGNGRDARLATDLLSARQGWPLSRWGAANLAPVGELRRQYIQALRSADGRDLEPLIGFMALNIRPSERNPRV
jgi:Fic-DOC domain mobile mystery protein B